MKAEVDVNPETMKPILRLKGETEGDNVSLALLRNCRNFDIDWEDHELQPAIVDR